MSEQPQVTGTLYTAGVQGTQLVVVTIAMEEIFLGDVQVSGGLLLGGAD